MMPLWRSLFHGHAPRRLARLRTIPLEQRGELSFETLEQRMMLTVTLLNTPDWVERGQGPITNAGNVDLTGNGAGGDLGDVQIGAVEAIAVDPGNQKHVFVATVNGGIWETSDVTDQNPLWTTTTDQLPSLSIGALAFSPVNHNVLYAGTGNYSSLTRTSASLHPEGGQEVGVYRTTDGGDTWTHLGFDTFKGMRIQSIIPTALNGGQTVFAATTTARGAGTGGVYQSDDSGNNWTRLSGQDGLPDAAVSHLVSSPFGDELGFYTAVVSGPGKGIYRSVKDGKNWELISNNIAAEVGIAIRIEFSVSDAGNNPVYAGLIGDDGKLINVYRSVQGNDGINNNGTGGVDEPAEATWTAIGATPPNILVRQGRIHFSILADKDVDNIVYVGGDRSPLGFVGGNLALGNSTTNTWTPISAPGAKNTAPHADSRDLVFAGDDILEADDGGIYRLVNPRGLDGDATFWESVIGNLSNTEVVSVALDNRNNFNPADDVILAGAMDNGSSERSAAGQWASTLSGDGMITQSVDTATSVHYFTSQFFQSFSRRVSAGPVTAVPRAIVGAPAGTKLTPVRGNSVFALGFDATMGNEVVVPNPGIFRVQYQVHATNGSRILVGSERRLYESFDGGNTFTSIGGLANGTADNVDNDNDGVVDDPGEMIPDPVAGLLGRVVSIAYGSAANPEAAYIGTEFGEIFLRTIAGGPFTRTNFVDAAFFDPAQDIVIDPNNALRAYAVSSTQGVFVTENGMDWTSITDNLTQLALPSAGVLSGGGINLRSVGLFNSNTPDTSDDVVLVGALGGVFRRLTLGADFDRDNDVDGHDFLRWQRGLGIAAGAVKSNGDANGDHGVNAADLAIWRQEFGTATGGLNWSEYGAGLPNAQVTDMEYDQRSDTLLVGTFGRGAWTLPDVSDTIEAESFVQVGGSSSSNTVRLVRQAGNPTLLDIFLNNPTTTPTLSVQLSVVQKVQVDAGAGADFLDVQSTNGQISLPNGIVFLGGPDVDTLILRNSTDSTDANGTITADRVTGLSGRLTFTSVEAINILLGSGATCSTPQPPASP